MKEYGIYIRQSSGNPYMIHIFNNIDSAKVKLFELVSLEEERGRPYFVDNDFFENRYNIQSKLKYFCIKERDVSEWNKFTTEIKNENLSNIIYLKNFQKRLTK